MHKTKPRDLRIVRLFCIQTLMKGDDVQPSNIKPSY